MESPVFLPKRTWPIYIPARTCSCSRSACIFLPPITTALVGVTNPAGADRLRELDSRPSLLNPLWYAGSYAIGALAGLRGDGWNLGFVVETERQVEKHLENHLASLPANDAKSRAIVEQMRIDEIAHGKAAQEMGAAQTPLPVRVAMTAMSKLMTGTTYHI